MPLPNGSQYICLYIIHYLYILLPLSACCTDAVMTKMTQLEKADKKNHKEPQVLRFRHCYFVILHNLLIVLRPSGQDKRNLYICMGSSGRKEQSAADMKRTEKSAFSQPLPYNICYNVLDYITTLFAHPFHGTVRLREKYAYRVIKSTHQAVIDIPCGVSFPVFYAVFISRHPKH